ncbi:MAG: hypothetical protein ACR2FH_09110 [Caulobacteraceae bacterium]
MFKHGRVAAAVFALIAVAAPALAQPRTTDQAIDALLGDHAPYRAAFVAVQRAVGAHDAGALAAWVGYPLRVKVHGRARTVRTPAAFVADYDAIVTPAIARAVTAQKYQALFVNAKGVMFGSGQLWLNGICADTACKAFEVRIVALQSAPRD